MEFSSRDDATHRLCVKVRLGQHLRGACQGAEHDSQQRQQQSHRLQSVTHKNHKKWWSSLDGLWTDSCLTNLFIVRLRELSPPIRLSLSLSRSHALTGAQTRTNPAAGMGSNTRSFSRTNSFTATKWGSGPARTKLSCAPARSAQWMHERRNASRNNRTCSGAVKTHEHPPVVNKVAAVNLALSVQRAQNKIPLSAFAAKWAAPWHVWFLMRPSIHQRFPRKHFAPIIWINGFKWPIDVHEMQKEPRYKLAVFLALKYTMLLYYTHFQNFIFQP